MPRPDRALKSRSGASPETANLAEAVAASRAQPTPVVLLRRGGTCCHTQKIAQAK